MLTASQNVILTNMDFSVTSAIAMRGLTPGTYYMRAFIDSNNNGVLDSWESWGYANYYGEKESMYDVRPVEVSHSAISPLVTLYIEDRDTDQDWFPDAYEYQQNSGSNFLTLIGPNDDWQYRGDSEINPNLITGSFIAMMAYMTTGTSEQDAFYSMAVSDDATTIPATPPAVTIQSLSFGATGATLDFALTAGRTPSPPRPL